MTIPALPPTSMQWRFMIADNVEIVLNDKPGVWTIRTMDLLGGMTATASMLVEP